MKTNQPPTVAKWLLRHLGSSTNNETILGDLDERYRQGRSVAWYWKQVLTAVIVGICNSRDDVEAFIAGWLAFWTLFNALFPLLGRCPVLVSIVGFISGLTVAYMSNGRRWMALLLFSSTVAFYWVCLGIISSPYEPAVRFYKLMALGLSRSAQVSNETLVGNLIVLTLFIWFGASVPPARKATLQGQKA